MRTKFERNPDLFTLPISSAKFPNNYRNEAPKLLKGLQAQAIEFINDPKKNTLTTNKVELSKIFFWFIGGFTKNGTIIDFLKQYANVKISPNAKVKHRKYDWRLNE